MPFGCTSNLGGQNNTYSNPKTTISQDIKHEVFKLSLGESADPNGEAVASSGSQMSNFHSSYHNTLAISLSPRINPKKRSLKQRMESTMQDHTMASAVSIEPHKFEDSYMSDGQDGTYESTLAAEKCSIR